MRFYLVAAMLIASSASHAQPRDPDDFAQLRATCIDMRISSEQRREAAELPIAALIKLLGCRRYLRMPMSVRPDNDMIAIFVAKVLRLNSAPYLGICTHGERSGRAAVVARRAGIEFYSVHGGTLFIRDVFDLQK